MAIAASQLTVKGLRLFLEWAIRNENVATNLFVALVARQNTLNVNAAAATNEGSGKVGIPVTAHGYTAGTVACLTGTAHYDGHYFVDASSSLNKVVITATYTVEVFTGAETIHIAPGPRTVTLSELVEIDAGNGYTAGGISLDRNSTDFNVLTEDLTNLLSYLRIKDVTWSATGGEIPITGLPARYMVLTDDNVTLGDRFIMAYLDLLGDVTISDTQTYTVKEAQLDLLCVTAP